ncbi:MAG: RNA polymerase sigma factor [Armatimonadetes bacterium]|nr:RNA polymerase sigma factor [Armatimonadota bacterium]
MKKEYGTAEGDLTLIVRAQRGDHSAFEEITVRYRTRLFQQAYRKLKNVEDAADVVQNTLLKAFQALTTFCPERPILPWLQRICSNCCIDLIRERKHRTLNIEDHAYCIADESTCTLSRTIEVVESDEIKVAMERLPLRYRRILSMRHMEDLDVNEIADRLNKPEGTVKSWLFRARSMLKKELGLSLKPAV